jgi:hypothetical protein
MQTPCRLKENKKSPAIIRGVAQSPTKSSGAKFIIGPQFCMAKGEITEVAVVASLTSQQASWARVGTSIALDVLFK